MNSYEFTIKAKPNGIQYGEIGYNFFCAREVLREGKPVGEYHIKLNDNSSVQSAVTYFQNQLRECEVGLVDPDGLLNLEYPIYIIIKDKMVLNDIANIFHEIDNELSKKGE